MALKELERIRLILRGGSVIEWRRLHFRTRDEVDRFLRLCLINPDDPVDQAWARVILSDAVDYLRRTFDYRVSDAVAQSAEIHDLFLYASVMKEPVRYRRIACVVLKVMHVIQHMEGRDILYRLAMSEAELQALITEKVLAVAEEMRGKGLPIVEFSHSHKTHQSIITKLLAKKETIAAQLYDKTRFRIVTRTRDDVLVVLYFLTQRLFPFNFVVPGQTQNSLINFKSLLSQYPHLAHHSEQLHLDPTRCVLAPARAGQSRSQEPNWIRSRRISDRRPANGDSKRGRGEFAPGVQESPAGAGAATTVEGAGGPAQATSLEAGPAARGLSSATCAGGSSSELAARVFGAP